MGTTLEEEFVFLKKEHVVWSKTGTGFSPSSVITRPDGRLFGVYTLPFTVKLPEITVIPPLRRGGSPVLCRLPPSFDKSLEMTAGVRYRVSIHVNFGMFRQSAR